MSRGKCSLKYSNHPGRLVVAAIKKNIDSVSGTVEEDGRYSILQLAQTIGISEGTVHHVLTNHLKLKKLCAR